MRESGLWPPSKKKAPTTSKSSTLLLAMRNAILADRFMGKTISSTDHQHTWPMMACWNKNLKVRCQCTSKGSRRFENNSAVQLSSWSLVTWKPNAQMVDTRIPFLSYSQHVKESGLLSKICVLVQRLHSEKTCWAARSARPAVQKKWCTSKCVAAKPSCTFFIGTWKWFTTNSQRTAWRENTKAWAEDLRLDNVPTRQAKK